MACLDTVCSFKLQRIMLVGREAPCRAEMLRWTRRELEWTGEVERQAEGKAQEVWSGALHIKGLV